MDERRKDPRVPVRLQTEIQFTNWEIFRLIYTINISQGGMNLELAQELAPGTRIKVLLRLPQVQPIEVEAEVKHSASMYKPPAGTPDPNKKPPPPRFAVGVQFVGLDKDKKAHIEKLIESHTTGPAPTMTRRGG